MSYHSPWKWSYLQQQWNCHMNLVLLLPAVAELPVFPLDSFPPLPSLQPSLRYLLPRPRALAHLDGYEQGYFKHVLYATLPPSLSPSHNLHHHLSRYQPIFLCPAHLALCCVIYSSLWDMWSLCWIPRTPGSQCFGRRRKRKNKENNLTRPADYQDILYDLRTCRFCQKTLITLNRNEFWIKYLSTVCNAFGLRKLPLLSWRCNSLCNAQTI